MLILAAFAVKSHAEPSPSLVFKLYAELNTLDKKWSVSTFSKRHAPLLHAQNIDLR